MTDRNGFMVKVSEKLEIRHGSVSRSDGLHQRHVMDDVTMRDNPGTLPEQVLEEVGHE